MSEKPNLFEVLRSSRLVAEQDLIALERSSSGDSNLVFEQLLEKKLLTPFQASHLKLGRWRRFVLGKYTILDRIASGGMGAVYRARHRLMERTVALKVLPSHMAKEPESIDRFYREAQSLAAIDHPNIIRAYDIDYVEGVHFIVLEYIDGISINDLILTRGPLSGGDAASFCLQAARGLDQAYRQAGLLHRDIKPENLIVDSAGTIKVLDLGLASTGGRTMAGERTHGTPDYASPEQLLDSDVLDTRSDIYSMGATLYFMLTSSPPFPEGDAVQKRVWHRTRQPRPIAAFRSDLADSLVALIERMMAKDPKNRPASFEEVASELMHHVPGDSSVRIHGTGGGASCRSQMEQLSLGVPTEAALFTNDEAWDQLPTGIGSHLGATISQKSGLSNGTSSLLSGLGLAMRWLRDHT